MTTLATQAFITVERNRFHKHLLDSKILTRSNSLISATGYTASNADAKNKFSATLADRLIQTIASNNSMTATIVEKKNCGQTVGNQFEIACMQFVKNCFTAMQHIRPGEWIVEQVKGRSEEKISKYAQYSHLADLKRLAEEHSGLATFLGHGYTIAPDVVIARKRESDRNLNSGTTPLVDNYTAQLTTLRKENLTYETAEEILHASISCKFTMRSDRAQNTRTEALNLLRNRKGRSPHIVSVTAEPTPSRIASLALGTGDVDCVYHFALHELQQLIEQADQWDDALELLNIMIEGKRLRDISDLPLDLAI